MVLKKYRCVKDYHPIIRMTDGISRPTHEPVAKKGDIFTQMGRNDFRYLSKDDNDLTLYESTLEHYHDCFIFVRQHISVLK